MGPDAAQFIMFGFVAAILVAALILMATRRPSNHSARADSPELIALLRIWEQNVKHMPQHSDLSRAYERISAVEQSVGEIRGTLDVVREVGARTEALVRTLVKHAMEVDAKGDTKGAD